MTLESVGRSWITVTRRSVVWRDWLRAYVVVIDDEQRGRVRNGEAATFDVAPGLHSVRIKIDWTGSMTLKGHVAAGETARFVCGPAGGVRSAWWRALVPNQYVALEFVPSASSRFDRP